ncbi:MAG: hypothetical protein WAS72_05815 [Saprospiraceae bacterium]
MSKKLLFTSIILVALFVATGCKSVREIRIGEINVAFFSVKNIIITPKGDKKVTRRPVIGRGKTLKAAMSDCYADGVRKYGSTPNELDSATIYYARFSVNPVRVEANGIW